MRISDFRIIARLDVKNDYVIKGIHLEGLRKVGHPNELAEKYYYQGADEIILQDSVASLYGRNNLYGVLERACKKVFVPIIIGGGIRTLDDVKRALDAGADRVCVNTGLIKNPHWITDIVKRYGSQCIVCSIEAKQIEGTLDKWSVYYDYGREDSGKDVFEWIKFTQDLGIGEILLTSVDQEGTKRGLDISLCEKVRNIASVPIIISGGAGNRDHIKELYQSKLVDGVAIASMIHYNLDDIESIKRYLVS